MRRCWTMFVALMFVLTTATTGCVFVEDTERGLGESCDDTDTTCEEQLSCLLILPVASDGSCLTGTANVCTRRCTVDADCADLGQGVRCARTCGSQLICEVAE